MLPQNCTHPKYYLYRVKCLFPFILFFFSSRSVSLGSFLSQRAPSAPLGPNPFHHLPLSPFRFLGNHGFPCYLLCCLKEDILTQLSEEEGMKQNFQDPAGVKILYSDFTLTVWFRIDVYLANSFFLQLLKGFSVSEPSLKIWKGPMAF